MIWGVELTTTEFNSLLSNLFALFFALALKNDQQFLDSRSTREMTYVFIFSADPFLCAYGLKLKYKTVKERKKSRVSSSNRIEI